MSNDKAVQKLKDNFKKEYRQKLTDAAAKDQVQRRTRKNIHGI